ncbi:piggyBac transposable element-derived protein 4 [Trichonephila inaurata madagascariensis]|uniref:PiggyBac transposable element-derived protein 4 n=1 Tax=Trichonephila inaurata madagascariensis TaxID=2747483 RepID=A0A8X7C0T9_9ARAC|nr:piggyBac transposable element-derived protein 4 [Trichonephila inaurata madagascariensis]
MRVRKFIWILGNIHLNDNNLMPKKSEKNFDKLYKVRPLLDHLSEMFLKVFKPGQKQAIDESMIKFKGRSSLKQYMPKKPIKRGYKVWMRCDSSGFACEFQIYTGKTEVERNLGERVEQKIIRQKPHVLFFDNYFTTYDLLKHLETQNITACGTVNMSRKNLSKNLLEDKKMKRGDFDWSVSNDDIACIK